MLDWTITLGNIGTVLTIIFFGGAFYWQTLSDSKQFRQNIIDIKFDLKILNKVISDLAVQHQRLDNQGERINRLDNRLDELRHGKGFVRQNQKEQNG